MDLTISLHDLLRILLYVAGIGALVYLTLVLKNLVAILQMVKGKLTEHEAVIDDTFQKIPGITENASQISANVSRISEDTAEMVDVVRPEVEKIAATVGGVTSTVDDISRSVDETRMKLANTASVVSDSITDTAKTISFNANNIMDYFYIVRELWDAIRDLVKKR